MRQGFDRLRYAPVEPFVRKRRWSGLRIGAWGAIWLCAGLIGGAIVLAARGAL